MRLIDVDEITDGEIVKYLGKEYGSCVPDVRNLLDDQPTMFEMEENGKNLMEIYKLFNIDGSLKRKLTVKEMVMLYHIADVMRGGRDEE